MNTKDVMKMFALMQDLYPRDGSLFVSADLLTRRAKSWAELLDDVPSEDGMNAVKEYAKSSTFAPLVSDVREYHESAKYHRYIERKKELAKPKDENHKSLAEWAQDERIPKEKRELILEIISKAGD